MAKYTDLRPTRPDDSLKKLLKNTANKQTIPYGNKVARAHEGTTFFATDGSSYRWDGETIAVYDTRLREAEKAVSEAREELAQAQADLADAKDRIGASSGDLSGYADRIKAAEDTLAAAVKDQESLVEKLKNTDEGLSALEARVDTAEGQSSQAVSAVARAQAQAEAAEAAVASASSQAQEALAFAQGVHATAENAAKSAEDAEAAARQAAGVAAGKGKVFYQGTAPVDGSSADLWVKTPGNTPHIFDGARWVPVTDKAASDAASAAASARSVADEARGEAVKAQQAAQLAQATADKAVRDAGQAVTAANGKSTNYYTSSAPPSPKTGDTWFTAGSFKTWSGSAWVEYTDPKISAAQAAADTAKASADGKNQVFRQASQPTAKAKGDIWFNTGSGNQIKVWDGRAWVDNLLGTTAIADAAITTAKIGSLDASKITTGTLSADRIGTGAVTADKLAGKSIDASKIVNGSITGVLIQNGAVTANKIQAGTITANSGIIASLDAGVISTGTLSAGRIGAKSITGDKINAESVAAAVGQFVKVDAKNVTVTQELAANIAKVMSLDAKKLIVSGEALIANATLLGDTVADRLNVTKKLVARDAIVDGTLDVAQLNVTEKMAAEIVNAMSVNAKKLVVTEDALMNQLTVIQNIVTPELIAQKVDARYARITDLEAGNLTLSGTFRSGSATGPGIVIPQNYSTAAGMKQLGIWLTRDGRAPGTDTPSLWGMTSGLWVDQQSTSASDTVPIHIRGQNGGGVNIYGSLKITPKTGPGIITTGGYGEIKLKDSVVTVDSTSDFFFSSGAVGKISGVNGVVLSTNGNIAFRRLNGNPYDSTYSGSGLLNVVLGSSTGRLYVQSSSKRFKTDISEMSPDDAWLDVPVVWYRDKESVRVRDEVLAREKAGDCSPRTAYESERIADAGRLVPGRIAEQAAEAGLAQTIFEADGVTPLSYDYARDGVMLIPHVRKNRDDIRELKERISELESLLEKEDM